MTDLDVALRVRLAYEPAAAKKAVADLDAIRAAGAKLGSQVGPGLAARGLGDLSRAATVSKVGVDELVQAGARFGDAARATRALTGDLAGAEAAAIGAGQAVGAVEAARPRTLSLEEEVADLLAHPGAPPVRSRRPPADALASPEPSTAPEVPATPAPPTPARAASPEAIIVRPVPAAAPVTVAAPAPAPAGDAYRDAKAEAHIAAMWPSPANPNHPAFARTAKVAGPARGTAEEQGAVEALGRAADKLATVAGPGKLAEAVAAVTPAATEARRHVDDVADAAQHAERAAESMARAVRAAGGGTVHGEGEEGHGAAAAGGRPHAGPGGLRGALIAGARPLRMERLVMSAFTPVGLAGLAGGLGMAEVGKGLKAAEDQAISFEAALVGLRRAVGDMPDDAFKTLQHDLLNVSTATGTAKEELAALAAAAARGGVPAAELAQAADRAVKVGNVLGVKPEEAEEQTVRYRKGWHADAARAEDTTDAVALLAQRNGADGGKLLDFVNGADRLRANRLSARQAAAIGATAQRAGLAPDAAQGLFGDLTEKLAFPEKAGDEFKNTLAHGLGINPSKARLDMISNPAVIVTQVLDSLKAMPEALRQRTAERLLGPEQGNQLAKLADQVDVLRRNFTLAEDAAQRSGAVEKLFSTFDETASAKVEKAGRSFEGFAARIGSKFLPAIKAAADGTARFFDNISRNMDADERATTIRHKLDSGEALTPDEQRSADHDPRVREKLDLDPDPAASAAERDRNSKVALKTIQDLDARAKETGDPQIRIQVQDLVRDFKADFPGVAIPGFAAGGRVTGPGGPREDKVHAKLSAGEFVIRAAMVDKHPELVRAINADAVPAYADGGPVRFVGAAAADASMPVRALQRGIERSGDAEGMARVLAKLGPETHGKPLTVEQIKAAIGEGTKAGVVAGMREAMDVHGGRAAAGGLLRTAYEQDGGGEASGAGGENQGGSGGDGGRGAPSLRYGRQGEGRGLPNLRRGRGPAAPGGGPAPYRDTPAGRPHAPGHPAAPYRHTPPRHPAADPTPRRPREGDTPLAPDDRAPQPAPGDGGSIAWSAAILKKKEGFIGKASWDVNHFRLGYGTDTITRADGSVHEVQRGDTVTREDAERDLKRRMPQFQATLRKQVGAANWDRLDPATQGALTSLGYNYGSFVPPRGKADYMKPLRDAVATGDKAQIAAAVRAMQGHNKGVNRQRRIEEASIIETGHLPASWHAREPGPAVARETPPRQPGQPAPAPAAEAHPAAPRRVVARRTPAAPAPVRMATGGRVVGPGGPREDRVSALLSAGEFVVHAAAAAKHPALLAALNGDQIPATSGGGALPARFSDPAERPAPPRPAAAEGGRSGGAMGGEAPGGAPLNQHFYGQFDPAREARRSMLESNREIRRAQARALHSVGRRS